MRESTGREEVERGYHNFLLADSGSFGAQLNAAELMLGLSSVVLLTPPQPPSFSLLPRNLRLLLAVAGDGGGVVQVRAGRTGSTRGKSLTPRRSPTPWSTSAPISLVISFILTKAMLRFTVKC